MLNDATGFKKIYLAAGYTDLRRGIDGVATMIRFRFPKEGSRTEPSFENLHPLHRQCLQSVKNYPDLDLFPKEKGNW